MKKILFNFLALSCCLLLSTAMYAQPANDNCAGVIDLGAETSPLDGTTVDALNDFGQDCLTNAAAPDVVYSIEVPDGQRLSIGQTVNSYDSKVRIAYGAACPGDMLIDCNDDPDVETIIWDNTTGASQTVYYVQSAFNTGSGTFTLAWSLGAIPPPPANNDCSGAEMLNLQEGMCSAQTTGTNEDASASGETPTPSCSSFGGGQDVWYSVTVGATGNVTVEVTTNGGPTDMAMQAYTGSCGSLTVLECDDDDGPGLQPLLELTGLTPGETVLFRVFEFANNAFGTFDICAFEPTGIASITAGAQTPCSTTDGTYTQEITVEYVAPPATGTLDVNGQSFPITGSPQTVTLVGLASDGAMVSVTASFSDVPEATLTESMVFTAPESCLECFVECPRDITVNLEAGACDAIVNYNIDTEGFCTVAAVGFVDYYAPDQWEVSATGSAMVDVFSATTLTMTTANAGLPSGAIAAITIPAPGNILFDWDWESTDLGNPDADPFGYILNGTWNALVDPTGADLQNGSAMIAVAEGDEFALLATSRDGLLGESTVTVTNFMAPGVVVPVLVEGLASGESFPEGQTTVTYEIDDNLGGTNSCSFVVNVLPYPNPTNQLSCVGQINVSLDENCEAFISADEVLKGGPYKCLDNYEVCVEGVGCGIGGVMVGSDLIGQNVEVSVIDPETGNTCWGNLLVEDKLAPILDCVDISIECDQDVPTTPGISDDAEFAVVGDSDAADPDLMILGRRDIRIPIQVNETGIITDLNVGLKFRHTWAADLDMRLVDPDGNSRQVFVTGCGNNIPDPWDIIMDDQSLVNITLCADVTPGIRLAPATVFGVDNELSSWNGTQINGEWNLVIKDNVDGDTGVFEEVTLYFTVDQAVEDDGSDSCSGDVDVAYDDEESDILCGGEFSKIITRTWTVTDAEGNTSTCEQQIFLRRKMLTDLTLPPDYDGVADTDPWGFQPSLECDGNWVRLADGNPSPVSTGSPGGVNCGTIAEGYEDLRIDICSGIFKVIRRWTVVDWCTGDIAEHTQLIKVIDSDGLNLTCPADQDEYVSGHDCSTGVQLIEPTASGSCGAPATFVPSISQGTLVNQGGTWFALDLPLGTTTVTWTVADDCGEETSCTYNINVFDNLPPVAVCEVYRQIGLTNEEGGFSKIFADAFDDGSHDNCSPDVWFKVIRMYDEDVDNAPHGSRSNSASSFSCGGAAGDDSAQSGWQVWFDDYVKFCCEDIGADPLDTRVIFRVYDVDPGVGPVFPGRHNQGGDLYGHYNDCMVDVDVQDKLPPQVVCPPDVTIDCDDPYELDNLDIYGTATVFDNCGATLDERVIPPADCSAGQRVIRRVFTATDNSGLTSQCIQNIVIEDDEPFRICDTQCRTFPLSSGRGCTGQDDPNFHTRDDGVEWPCDIELFECIRDVETELAPENLRSLGVDRRDAEPQYFGEQCAQLADDYEDEVFYIVEDACFKVIRTWTVIDWCQFDAVTRDPEDPNRFLGWWQYIQIIKVKDTTAPTQDPITFEEDCLDTDDDCNIRATLRANATDECNVDSEIEYRWSIDAFNDGSFDFAGTGSVVSDYLPAGTHLIRFVAKDLCDNESDPQDLVFTVSEECKAPTPYCDNGIATVVMPSTGSVEVWARDLDEGSFDNCTDMEDLEFQIQKLDDAGNPIGVPTGAIELTCADIPNGISETVEVRMYVIDEAGNRDYCITYILLQDTPDADQPEGVCIDVPGDVPLTGTISTEEAEGVTSHPVQLIGTDNNGTSGVVLATTMTVNGSYSFGALIDGVEYLAPAKNDDASNGLSTLDLIAIQRHILGVDPLDSPYKMIAADADNNEAINVLDALELQEIILGLRDHFRNNTSWRYVSSDEVMDMSSPYTFEEPLAFTFDPNVNQVEDFVAVKIGDVNSDANVGLTSEEVEIRSTLTLVAQAAQVEGDVVRVPVTAENFSNVSGYQFTLNHSSEFIAIESGVLNITADKVADFGNGVVTTTWYSDNEVSYNSDAVLFTLVFADEAGDLEITSDITRAEAYVNGNRAGVELAVATRGAATFALYQNEPNPFTASTSINFDLPTDALATVTIMDLSGKQVYVKEVDGVAGFNSVTVKSSDLSAVSGVLYYQVETVDYSATKKMILVK